MVLQRVKPMSDIKVKVNPVSNIRVRLGSDNAIKVISGGGGGGSLAELSDVDLTNLKDGQLIAYNSITNKFEPVYLDGGTY